MVRSVVKGYSFPRSEDSCLDTRTCRQEGVNGLCEPVVGRCHLLRVTLDSVLFNSAQSVNR
jgi:hypothetical protein